ncbi:MAG: peptidylprolyl isomerase [Thermoguttaceae bacterium]
MRVRSCLVSAMVVVVVSMGSLRAQDAQPMGDATTPASGEAVGADGAASAGAEFERILSEWKTMLGELLTLQTEFESASDTQRAEIQKQWKQLIEQGDAMEPKLLAAAEKAYAEAPNTNKGVTDLLQESLFNGLMAEDYESAARVGKLLVDNRCEDKRVANLAGLAAFAVSELDDAEKYLNQAKQDDVFAPIDREMLDGLAGQFLSNPAPLKQARANEQQIRDAEAKADDLPRILMETNKGPIEIELFENEAPMAVANIISLVEQGYYNGLTFHRVLPGFMAQGGCPDGTGTGGPGYNIPCECYQPNHRLHFRGSLSMAHAGRDTGGSQFFLTFLPTKHLDGIHTVFGRVIKGFDVLSKLQRRDPSAFSPPQADRIVKATVLRKRDHEYVPTKTGQ